MADARRQAFDTFVRLGWSPAQAAGIVANLIAESNLNPAAVGDGGQAYGIAQWHPDRQQHFRDFMGKEIQGSTLDEQLAFVAAELEGPEKAAGDALRACTTARAAGACVSERYERPANRESEAAKRGTLAERIFADYASAAPATAARPQQERGMPILALISAFGPILAQLIPQIANVVSGDRAKQNLDLAGKVFQTITDVTGQPNVQAAVEVLQNDKEAVKKATDAVVTNPDIQPYLEIVEVGGGAGAARDADIKQQLAEKPFWQTSAVFWVSVLLLPLVYWLVGSLIVGGVEIPPDWPAWVQLPLKLFGTEWNGESRSGGFNLVIGLVLGGICGVYYGVSVTQARQQQQPAQPAVDKP